MQRGGFCCVLGPAGTLKWGSAKQKKSFDSEALGKKLVMHFIALVLMTPMLLYLRATSDSGLGRCSLLGARRLGGHALSLVLGTECLYPCVHIA